MSEVKEVILPVGGMNSDDVYNAIPEGDYPNFAYGLRSAILGTGNNMSCENIKGTQKLNYTLPPGNNKCIGWCRDYENNGYIYFVYNSNDIHKIVQYIPSSNTFNDYQSPLFKFSVNHRIYHADKIGDLLYWTDGYNPPRKVNLKTMFSGGYGANFDEQVLDVIKYPYVKSPVCSYGSNYNYKRNLLRGKLFQFAIRYVYDDYEKSCWSPISKVPLPGWSNIWDVGSSYPNFPSGEEEETISGLWLEDYKNNFIKLEFETGHPIVKRIEIAAREGNIGDWLLIHRIDKYYSDGSINTYVPSNAVITWDFYNDIKGETLDQADNARLFDYVPQIAGTQAVIEKNMLTYGDITEGYGNIDIDVKLKVREFFPLMNTGKNLKVLRNAGTNDIISIWLSDMVLGATIVLTIVNQDKKAIASAMTTYQASDTYTTFLDRICEQLNDNLYVTTELPYLVHWYIPFGTASHAEIQIPLKITTPSTLSDQSTYANLLPSYSQKNLKYKSWLPGKKEFGLVYYDRGNRSGAVNSSLKSEVYVYDTNESIYNIFSGNIEKTIAIEWSIYHKPPVWATHYQWVFSPSNIYNNLLDVPIQFIGVNEYGNIEIDINTGIVALNNSNKKCVVGAYVWQKGDRIIFRKYREDVGSGNASQIGYTYIKKVLEYEINGQDATTGRIYIDAFDYKWEKIGIGTIVTIFSYNKSLQQKVFYEIGEVGEIGDAGLPSRYHKTINHHITEPAFPPINDQSTSGNTPARGVFDSGDVYIRTRVMPTGVFSCRALNYSDWYKSEVYDIGRPNAIIQDMRRLRLQDIRRGGILIEDSKINGMSTFKVNDKIDLTAKYGIINKLVYRGFTLKVYQTYKVTPIYINRSSQTDVSGKESLIFSDKVMAIGNTPNEEWGTDLPASVISYGNSIYFFDRHSAQWIWDAGNGLIPINNKMSKEFKLLSSKKQLDVVAWVNEYGEIIANFSYAKDGELVNIRETKTLMFNTADKRWKTYLPFYDAEGNYPEMYAGTDDSFVSWINGSIYLHNVGAYNEFFGVQHTQKIPILFNNGAKTDKIFQTIEVVSTDVFDCPNDGDIFIMDEDALPQGMKSRLKAGQFKWKEGKYVAGFMRDVTTPGSMPNKIINGRPLRGKVLCCILHNNSNNLVILKSVTIKGITSELNS